MAFALASVLATPVDAPPVAPRVTRIAYDEGSTPASSLDWFWMTALGTALPVLGTPVEVLDKSGLLRQLKTCGFDTGRSYVSGISHDVFGEVFVGVYADVDVVSVVTAFGAHLEGDALFDVDVCTEQPAPGSRVELGGREVIVDVCDGAVTVGDTWGRSLCEMASVLDMPLERLGASMLNRAYRP